MKNTITSQLALHHRLNKQKNCRIMLNRFLKFWIFFWSILIGFNANGTEKAIASELIAHQAESSIVTQKELECVEHWMKTLFRDESNKESTDLWLDGWIGTALPFSFKYDGQPSTAILSQWKCKIGKSKKDSEWEWKELAWTDSITGLRVTWEIKHSLHFPAVDWILWFENTGAKDTAIIENIQSLDMKLHSNVPGKSFRIHGVKAIGGSHDDCQPFTTDIPFKNGGGILTQEVNLEGESLPFFNIQTPQDKGVCLALGWTGLGSLLTTLTTNDDRESANRAPKQSWVDLNIRSGMKESHFVLHPGEKVRSPKTLLVFWEGKFLHGQNMLRRLLHSHYVPKLKGKPFEPLVTFNTWGISDEPGGSLGIGGGFAGNASEKEFLPYVKACLDMGVEVFTFDAGWWDTLGPDSNSWGWNGDWRVSKKKFPRGFKPFFTDKMDLGVWLAPESVDSEFLNHPEWLRPGQGETMPGNYPDEVKVSGQGVLRLEIPEAREWFLKQLDALVKEEGVKGYRQDFADYGPYQEREDRKGIIEMKHNAGLYTLLDEIIKRYPFMVMEAGLGAFRIDLETVSRFHWHQPTDSEFSPELHQQESYGMNLFLPGGTGLGFCQSMNDYGAWSSFAQQLCFFRDPLCKNPKDPFSKDFSLEQAKKQIALYKHLRHLLSGDFYPLTEYSRNNPWLGMQFHRADLNEGFALIFRRTLSPQSPIPSDDTLRVILRGLNPKQHFRIHWQSSGKDEIYLGADLSKGINVIIPTAPGAEMLSYEPTK